MWWKRKLDMRGAVFFRGSLAPALDELDGLRAAGVSIHEEPPGDDEVWRAVLLHPKWGDATLSNLRGAAPLPPELVEFSPGLTESERARILQLAESSLQLEIPPTSDNVLRERKRLLRFMAAVLGGDGIVVNPFTNPLGVNGIVYHRGSLFVANTTKRHVVRIPIRGNGSAGTPEVFADIDPFLSPESVPPLFVPVPPLLDGIAVDILGNLYVLVVGQHKLARLTQDGDELQVLADFSDGLQLAASGTFGKRTTLFIANFAFLVGPDNAAVMQIHVGLPGPPLRRHPFRRR